MYLSISTNNSLSMWSDNFLCLIYIFLTKFTNVQFIRFDSYYKEINDSRHEKEEVNETPYSI